MKLILLSLDRQITNSFRETFKGFNDVEIFEGRFEHYGTVDCLVSPANSFGIMDGGMDKLIIDYFGSELQANVQTYIIEKFYGEQPVGTTFILPTGHKNIPYLAHTPTMRTPRVIAGKDNIYTAMKSMLIEAKAHPEINTVACPALGAGTGRVHSSIVAYQMALAFYHVNNKPSKIDWNFAVQRTNEIEKCNSR